MITNRGDGGADCDSAHQAVHLLLALHHGRGPPHGRVEAEESEGITGDAATTTKYFEIRKKNRDLWGTINQ